MAEFLVTIEHYPIVIEPATAVIEATAVLPTGEQKAIQLWRLDPVAVHQATPIAAPGATHFFGDEETVAASRYLLVYTVVGLLTSVLVRVRGLFEEADISCDVNGAPSCLPSLRLVFKDTRARDVFLYYLDKVQNGFFSNPSVAQALSGLAEKIRVIDVAPLGGGGHV